LLGTITDRSGVLPNQLGVLWPNSTSEISLLFYVNHAQIGARPRPPPPSQTCFVAASFDEWDVRALLVLHSCTRMVICRLLFLRSRQSPLPLPSPRSSRCTPTQFQDERGALKGINGIYCATTMPCGESMEPTSSPRLGSSLPHLHRDWAHRCHICAGTRLTVVTSARGLGSPLPHLHSTRLTTTRAPGLGSQLAHLRWD